MKHFTTILSAVILCRIIYDRSLEPHKTVRGSAANIVAISLCATTGMVTMYRNKFFLSLFCGVATLVLSPTSQANDRCYDSSLKPIDRLRIRMETGSSLSTQEIKCQKLENLRALQTARDDRYFTVQASDDLFRKDVGTDEILSISSSSKQTLNTLTISDFATQKDNLEKQPIDTLKGFKSVKDER